MGEGVTRSVELFDGYGQIVPGFSCVVAAVEFHVGPFADFAAYNSPVSWMAKKVLGNWLAEMAHG